MKDSKIPPDKITPISLLGDVIAVIGVGLTPFFVMTWLVLPAKPYGTAICFSVAGIPASIGMLCSNRIVRAVAMLVVVGFASGASYSLLFDFRSLK
ncbi:MAG TPA: hypothetical protein VG097_07125 [Gemmata sp.]|jgi:hypothetical protein|nr:hypothetical protein [Gemmata sp.]